MEIKAGKFVPKPNNNQKKTKNNLKASERRLDPGRRGFIRSRPGACAMPLCTFARRAEITFSFLRFYISTLLQFLHSYVLH